MIPLPGKAPHDKLKIAFIRKKTKFYRISDPAHPNPLFFNTNQSGRFNSPNGEYGVCYMADSFDAAFAESLIQILSNGRFGCINIQNTLMESDTIQGIYRMFVVTCFLIDAEQASVTQTWGL